MSIVHSKVSGLPNTEAGKVGGSDWDHAHLHGPGDMFIIGFAWFPASSVDGVHVADAEVFGAISSLSYSDQDYQVVFQLQTRMVDGNLVVLPDLPVVPGATIEYFMEFSYLSASFCPQILTGGGISNLGKMTFNIGPFNGVNAPFSIDVEVTAKLYAIVR